MADAAGLVRRFQLGLTFVRGVWLEARSFFGRIGILYKNNLHRCGISLGPTWESKDGQRLRLCIQKRNRILSIRKMLSIHPAASPVDVFLLLESLDTRPTAHPRLVRLSLGRSRARQSARIRGSDRDSCNTGPGQK